MWFLVVAIVATLFSCQGNGNQGNTSNPNQHKPDDPNTPSTEIKKVVITFDSKKIVVNNANDQTVIPSGKEVEVGTNLYCALLENALEKNELFDSFLANTTKINGSAYASVYIVKVADAVKKDDKNVINITFSTRPKTNEKVKIIFPDNIEAWEIEEGGRYGSSISTGELVDDGTNIGFNATVSAGKMIGTWLINDQEKAPNPQNKAHLLYVVAANEAKTVGADKVIEVKVTEIDAKTVYLQFDENFIEGITNANTQEDITQSQAIDSGTKVAIRLNYEKIREKYSQGQVMDSWLINGNKTLAIATYGPGYGYTVNEKDAKMEGDKLIIKIGLKFRDGIKVKLKFDDKTLTASEERGPTPIEYKNGDLVDEGKLVAFLLKDDNKIVEKWMCNKEEYIFPTPNKNVTLLEISKDRANKEGNEYVIHMEAVMRDAQMFTLKFDPPITCRYNQQNAEAIPSGTSVKEGKNISFTATLPEGQVGEKWIVNDKSIRDFEKRGSFNYTVKASDAKNGVIEVKLSTHSQKTVEIVYEKDGIKGRRLTPQNHYEDLNGSEVKEGDKLEFRFQKQNQIVDAWIINGKKYKVGSNNYDVRVGDNGDYVDFTLTSGFIVSEGAKNVVKVSYEVHDPEDIKIEFDSNELECTVSQNSISSGDKVQEGETVHFKAKDGVFVKSWFLNGKDRHIAPSQTTWFYVLKSSAIQSREEWVIKVSVKKREPLDCTIKFDPNKVSCKKENEIFETETTVKEGTELTFTALGVQLQEYDNILWKFANNNIRGESGKTTIKYKVNASDVYYSSKRIIEVSWEKQ